MWDRNGILNLDRKNTRDPYTPGHVHASCTSPSTWPHHQNRLPPQYHLAILPGVAKPNGVQRMRHSGIGTREDIDARRPLVTNSLPISTRQHLKAPMHPLARFPMDYCHQSWPLTRVVYCHHTGLWRLPSRITCPNSPRFGKVTALRSRCAIMSLSVISAVPARHQGRPRCLLQDLNPELNAHHFVFQWIYFPRTLRLLA